MIAGMRFTLNTLGCPSWTLEHAAEMAREYGYDGVDLRLVDGERVTPDLLRANLDRIKRLFRRDGLKLEVLASGVHLSMNDGDERRENEDETRQFMELAEELEVPLVRIFGGTLKGIEEAQGIPNVTQSLERLAPEAERRGVVVTLETHDAFSSAAVVARTIAPVPSKGIAATWDMHHTYKMGETPAQVWELLGERMVNVHVKDAKRSAGARAGWELLLLGEGEIPVAEGLRLLREKGYDAAVSVEWEKAWHPEIPDPEVAFPQHLKLMREYLAEAAPGG